MTARMVVMMTPDDKRALEARAALRGMSASEYVRRVSHGVEPELDEGLLEAVIAQMEANTAAMRKAINDTCDRVDGTFAEIDARRAAHAAALAAANVAAEPAAA